MSRASSLRFTFPVERVKVEAVRLDALLSGDPTLLLSHVKEE
jgi:hypothetical protein